MTKKEKLKAELEKLGERRDTILSEQEKKIRAKLSQIEEQEQRQQEIAAQKERERLEQQERKERELQEKQAAKDAWILAQKEKRGSKITMPFSTSSPSLESAALTKDEKLKELKSRKKKKKKTLSTSANKLRELERNTKTQQDEIKKAFRKQKVPDTVQRSIRYNLMYEDGVCEVIKGLYSKTIKFSDINYQIAKRDEQIEIFSRYSEFLNYFDSTIPFQIMIVNRIIDKEEFRSTMFLDLCGDNLDDYTDEYNNILNKKALQGQNSTIREKYLTFSVYAPTYESAVVSLNRVEIDIENIMKNLGCEIHTLSGHERLELFYNTLRQKDEKFTFNYDDLFISDLTTKDFISPQSFDFTHKNVFEFGDRFGQVLYLKDLPPDLSDKLLSELSDIPINMQISLQINSVDQDKALDLVKKKISFMDQQKIDEQLKAIKAGYDAEMIPHELRYSLKEAEELLDDLQNKNQRMFKLTVMIFTAADDEETLAEQIYQISSIARKNNCKVATLDYMQEDALCSILPIGYNFIDIQRTLTTASTAVFIPFTTQELFQSGGMYYGLNALSHNLIFFDRKSLKCPNGWILGTPGSGKSFAAKREIITNLLRNRKDEILIIDPEREYTPLAAGFGGEVVYISQGSGTHINPMDISDSYGDDRDPVSAKCDFMLSMCELVVGGNTGLTAIEKTIIDRAVKLTYGEYYKKKIRSKDDIPTLKDFYAVLKNQPEPEAQNLAISLEFYVLGSQDIFAQQTDVDLQKRLVVFDIKELGKQLKTLGMLIVLDMIWNRITENRAKGIRTWVYIDEIYLLFRNEYCSNFLYEFYKRARKWGAIPTGITQNVEDLLLSDNARSMLSNSDFIMMLNQATSDRKELADLLNISAQQLGYVTHSPPGQGLLFVGNAILPFVDQFPTDTQLYKLMTTKPEEIAEQQAIIEQLKQVV